MDEKWQQLEEALRELIKNSRRPDYIDHATTTREWLLKLCPEATGEMKMAAFAHDIERCVLRDPSEVGDEDYLSYKRWHAERSAKIMEEMMTKMDFSKDIVEKVCGLIKLHEEGGYPEADLIRDADSLSFMSNNLPRYFAKRGQESAAVKIKYMYERASEKAKKLIRNIKYEGELADVVSKAIII